MSASVKAAILPIILALLFTGCDRNISIGIGEELTIPFNKTATMFDNGVETVIKFTKLVEESRCPPGMVCFWEGRAVVEILVNNNTSFELESRASNDASIVNTAEYGEYIIELKSVSFDSDDDYGIEKKYSIIVELSRL